MQDELAMQFAVIAYLLFVKLMDIAAEVGVLDLSVRRR